MNSSSAVSRDPQTNPSTRHLNGLPRCQVRCRRGGHQCPRAARAGFRVCWMHGAGSAKREREARRRNPKLAPLRHGFRAQRATLALLRDAEPDFADAYASRVAGAGYTSVREERALAEALLHRYLDRADLRNADALDAAMAAIGRIVSLKKRELSVEQQLVPMSPAELVALLRGIGRAVRECVSADDRARFNALVRELLPRTRQ